MDKYPHLFTDWFVANSAWYFFIKRISYILNIQYLAVLISSIDKIGGGMFLIHYIAPAGMAVGIIAFGLLSWWAIIAQVAILAAASIINFMAEMHFQNLFLAEVTFAICAFFLFYGSGKHLEDYYFKMQK